MSEYQFYDFRAFDRLLSDAEMRELREWSTRAHIAPNRFSNSYHYGNLRADPNQFMERYFDSFVYFANWGTRWFMVRVPERLLTLQAVLPYWVNELFTCRQVADRVILSFCVDDASDDAWLDEESLLATLSGVRPALMRGDHRVLYLGWLLGVQLGVIEGDEQEPPIPPGLGELDQPLIELAEFLGIDSELIAAAAERSDIQGSGRLPERDIRAFIRSLTTRDRDALLCQMIVGKDLHLPMAVQQRVARFGYDRIMAQQAQTGASPGLRPPRRRRVRSSSPRRPAADILSRARILAENRKQREASRRARQKARRERAQAAARDKQLQDLMGKDESLWADVERLIGLRTPKSYDQAVLVLADLRDLADLRGDRAGFARRLSRLYDQHRRKRTLLDRIDHADLSDVMTDVVPGLVGDSPSARR